MFITLLTSTVSVPNHTKCMSLRNQKCMARRTLVNLHPNEYSQYLYYYIFAVKLDRCVGSCNTLNDLPKNVCVPSDTEDLNLSKFNMITARKNKSKALTKHISCACKCRFDGRKCNSNQKWNNNKCQYKCKNIYMKEIILELGYM